MTIAVAPERRLTVSRSADATGVPGPRGTPGEVKRAGHLVRAVVTGSVISVALLCFPPSPVVIPVIDTTSRQTRVRRAVAIRRAAGRGPDHEHEPSVSSSATQPIEKRWSSSHESAGWCSVVHAARTSVG